MQRTRENKTERQFLYLYLVLFEHSVHQQGRLFIHPLSDCVSHGVVWLQAASEGCATVFIVNVLLGVTVKDMVEFISLLSTRNTRLRECCTEKINIVSNHLDAWRMFYSLDDETDIHLGHIFAVWIWDLLFLIWGLRRLMLFILFILYRYHINNVERSIASRLAMHTTFT